MMAAAGSEVLAVRSSNCQCADSTQIIAVSTQFTGKDMTGESGGMP
jgi:hypothetical protein